MASGALHKVAYVRETIYDTTPATPAWKYLRNTSCTLGVDRDTLTSVEIASNGNRTPLCTRSGANKGGGDIGFELWYGDLDDWFEAVFCGTWTTDVLKTGNIRRSFSIERFFSDIPTVGSKPYMRLTGAELEALSLRLAANAFVTGSFTVISSGAMTLGNAIVTGATYDTPGSTCPMDAFTGVLKEGGVPVGLVTEMTIDLKNNFDTQFVLGQRNSVRPEFGNVKTLEGTATVLFNDTIMLEKFIDETESSIEAELTSPTGSKYQMLMPRIKYLSGRPDVTGPSRLLLTMKFQGFWDNTVGVNTDLMLTRIP